MNKEMTILDLDDNPEAYSAIEEQLKTIIQDTVKVCEENDETPEFTQAALQESLDNLFVQIHEEGAVVYANKRRLLGYVASVTYVDVDQIKIHLEPKYQSQQTIN